jgi:hypothetical protein
MLQCRLATVEDGVAEILRFAQNDMRAMRKLWAAEILRFAQNDIQEMRKPFRGRSYLPE